MIVEYLGGEGDGSAAFPNAKISDAFFQKNAKKKKTCSRKNKIRNRKMAKIGPRPGIIDF